MQQLPQTARLALGRAIASDGHPEPDQLAALVEQALSPDRRDSILNHLAACYTCREEVSLILPQMSEVEAHPYKEIKTVPQRFGLAWASLRSLPLRWAGVAATAAIIVGAVWVGRLEQPAANPAEAHVFRAEPEQPWTMTGSDTTSTTAAAVPAEAQQRSGASSLPSRQKTAVSDPQVIVASRGNAVQPFTTQQSETLNRTEALNRTETLNRTMSLTAAARRNGASQGVPAEAATMASNLASNQGPASNSNPVFNSLWTTGMVTAGAPANIPGQPVWKISSAGTLQKSVDSGRTWDDLALPPGARLRAASAVGDQVWLGASGAVLYHSTDGGKQWMRVIPFARGTQLSGEVLAIEFADPQHGSVTTSTGSRWTTLDAGRTWNVQ